MVHKGQPLTLIGDSVTGKSHLLMGLGAEAEKLAQAVINEGEKAAALARVAQAVAGTDPDHAKRLAIEAEGIARSILNEDEKAAALVDLAKAAAAILRTSP